MYLFYVTKGHTIDELVNLSAAEKILMHHAMEKYYESIASLLGGKGGTDVIRAGSSEARVSGTFVINDKIG